MGRDKQKEGAILLIGKRSYNPEVTSDIVR